MFPIIKLRIVQLKYDYKRIVVMIFLTMFLAFIFGYSFNDVPKIAVIDKDNTSFSKKLISMLEKEKNYNFYVISDELEDSNMIVFIIDKGFENSLINSLDIDVSIMSIKSDVEEMNIEFLVKNKILKLYKNYVITENLVDEILKANKNLNRENVFSDIYKDISTDDREYIRINQEIRKISTPKFNNTIHSILGMTVMFVAFTTVFSIANILEDKELGTFARMLISPVKRYSIVWQSMIVSIVLGMIQIFIILYLSSFIFDVNYGSNYIGIFIISLVFVYSISALGFLISMFVKTYAQLSVIIPIVLTSFAMIGGCMWPLEIVSSKILIGLSYLTPHMWAIEGFTDLLVSYKLLNEVTKPVLILIFMGIFFTIIGTLLLNKFEEK